MTEFAPAEDKTSAHERRDAQLRKRYATAPREGLYTYYECVRCGLEAARRQDLAGHDCEGQR